MSRVYTIPPNAPFLPSLARGLVAQFGDRLADASVFLPSRRAIIGLRQAFLEVTDGQAILLPAMRAIGEADPDELAPLATSSTPIAPAIAPLRRQLMLAQLVLAKGGVTHEKAMRLASELADFLDELQTEQVDPSALASLVPDDYAEHWRQVMLFLAIVAEAWPKQLASDGLLDPAERRNRLLQGTIEGWRAFPPKHPMIAAGITGTVPAVASLLMTVSRLPQGQLVLPGLDQTIGDRDWQDIGATPVHPQHGLHQLLSKIGIERHQVQGWPWSERTSSRANFLSEVMRPAGMTEAWQQLHRPPLSAYERLRQAEASHTAHEAMLLALQVRAALEEPEQTVALVTGDRSLARRCSAELARWGIHADDSSGTPLDQTPPGSFLLLIAHAIIDGLSPIPLLSMLKHPLCRGGLEQGALRQIVRRMERLVLRGPRMAPGLDILKQAIVDVEETEDIIAWLDRFDEASRTLRTLAHDASAPLDGLIIAHLELAAWLATDETGVDGELWAKEAGEAASRFMTSLQDAAGEFPELPASAYPAILAVLMAGETVRPRAPRHPRVSIFGQLEARLMNADLVLIGALNEGVWPRPPEPSPWLNRRLRQDLGLPPPELQIGIAAHDFVMAASAPNVLLTRTQKDSGGTPTTPSRWLSRLDAVATATGIADNLSLEAEWLQWAAEIDQPDNPPLPMPPPEPKPPLAARPRQFSVTDIEQLIRDPYGFYARRVLKLAKLDPIDADPSYAERGTIIHAALEKFVRTYPDHLPERALEELLKIGRDILADHAQFPQVLAIWWPRFESIAAWFIEQERLRRTELARIRVEAKGILELATDSGPFVVRARADRIELSNTGDLALIDYKTGTPPPASQVRDGIAPQLPISAAIALAGGFGDDAGLDVDAVTYWALSGGGKGGVIHDPTLSRGKEVRSAMDLASDARDGLIRLITYFDNPSTPYRAIPRPEIAPAYSDYDHLARVDEWRGGDGSE